MNGPSAKNVKDFRLIDCGWIEEFQAASKLKTDELFVISPFIKLRSVKRLTAGKKKIQVLGKKMGSRLNSESVDSLASRSLGLDQRSAVRGQKSEISHLRQASFTKFRRAMGYGESIRKRAGVPRRSAVRRSESRGVSMGTANAMIGTGDGMSTPCGK